MRRPTLKSPKTTATTSSPGEKVLLIVENDLAFASMLLQAGAPQRLQGAGRAPAVRARWRWRATIRPALITLDIFLPDMEGWRILERLKADLATRHIPVCVVSTDDSRERALNSGAVGFLAKPLQSIDEVDAALGQLHGFVQSGARKLLVAMRPSPLRESYVAALAGTEIDAVVVETADAARSALARNDIDCLVTDGTLAGFGRADAAEFIEAARPPGSCRSCSTARPPTAARRAGARARAALRCASRIRWSA